MLGVFGHYFKIVALLDTVCLNPFLFLIYHICCLWFSPNKTEQNQKWIPIYVILTTWRNACVLLRKRLKNHREMQLQRRFAFLKTQEYIINQNCRLLLNKFHLRQILNTGEDPT